MTASCGDELRRQTPSGLRGILEEVLPKSHAAIASRERFCLLQIQIVGFQGADTTLIESPRLACHST